MSATDLAEVAAAGPDIGAVLLPAAASLMCFPARTSLSRSRRSGIEVRRSRRMYSHASVASFHSPFLSSNRAHSVRIMGSNGASSSLRRNTFSTASHCPVSVAKASLFSTSSSAALSRNRETSVESRANSIAQSRRLSFGDWR